MATIEGIYLYNTDNPMQPTMNALMNFLGKHGPSALYDLLDNLNSGRTHREVARQLDMDEATLSRLIRRFFKVVYTIKPMTLEIAEIYQQVLAHRHAEAKNDRATIFQLKDGKQAPPHIGAGESDSAGKPPRKRPLDKL